MALTVYDKAKWHLEAETAPTDLQEYQAGTHIAFFLQWCYEKKFLHKDIIDIIDDYLSQNKKLNFREILFVDLDGLLTNEELNSKGKRFANAYYRAEKSRFVEVHNFYLDDYKQLIKPLFEENYDDNSYLYVDFTNDNYKLVKQLLDARFEEYKNFSEK